MMMKRVVTLSAACWRDAAPQEAPVQKAQQGKIEPERSLNMEQLCKDQAARRYNTTCRKLTSPGLSVSGKL
jgi:hypothetical protein